MMITIAIAATAASAVLWAMRARTGSNPTHTGLAGSFRGFAVPAAALVRVEDVQRRSGTHVDGTPTTGVVSAHLLAPPD